MVTHIISIDPSASKNVRGDSKSEIGWAHFVDGELYEVGELDPDPEMGFTRLRNWLRNKIRMARVRDDSPDIWIACETAFLGPNANIFLGLVRAKAHIEAVALDAQCHYREIAPKTSFHASTGLTQYPLNAAGKRSGTRKGAIRDAVLPRYGLPDDTTEHVVDAISIAEAILKEKRPV